MKYQQLTLDERYQISSLRGQNVSPADIAKRLGRHRSTVTRELKRNVIERTQGELIRYYNPIEAQRTADKRRVAKGITSRKIQGELMEIVESKLRQAWSPEQISGRLREELPHKAVSHETIYQHVIRDAREKRGALRYCLRFGGYKHHRLRESKHAEMTRSRKRRLADRPKAANERKEVGHWERDCVLGSGETALLTLVERKTRYSRIRRVSKLDVEHVSKATIEALAQLAPLTRSLTNDNGQEFGRAHQLEAAMKIPIYFCRPSSPWQRGSIENLNGLVRQFVPKRTDIDTLPEWAAKSLEDTLNHRPRKTLGFRTPHEVLFGDRMKLMSPSVHFGLEFSPPNWFWAGIRTRARRSRRLVPPVRSTHRRPASTRYSMSTRDSTI
jgi:IS30 family transposase